jgi:deazaflavin-dependent oxidoreductase (nitroreductase family)
VASAAGAARNPAWYHNLAAHPDQAWIETPGREVAVTAEQLHGAERDEAWRQITAAAPRFADYQRATDRELPIIHLVRARRGSRQPATLTSALDPVVQVGHGPGHGLSF